MAHGSVRLGGCPSLALQALHLAEGATPLEEAVAMIAKEQEAAKPVGGT